MNSIFKLFEDFKFFKNKSSYKKENFNKIQNKSTLQKLIEKITFLGGIYVSSDGFEILFKIPKISIANDDTFLKKCAEDFKLQGLTLKVKKI